MCKEVWCHGLRKDGGCLHEGGKNCLKYLLKECNRKEGKGKKILQRREQAG